MKEGNEMALFETLMNATTASNVDGERLTEPHEFN